jgi:hypothetical protein
MKITVLKNAVYKIALFLIKATRVLWLFAAAPLRA